MPSHEEKSLALNAPDKFIFIPSIVNQCQFRQVHDITRAYVSYIFVSADPSVQTTCQFCVDWTN